MVWRSEYEWYTFVLQIGLMEYGICGENRTTENVKRYLKSLFTPRSSGKYLMYLFTNRIITKVCAKCLDERKLLLLFKLHSQDDKPWETAFRFLYLSSLLTIFVSTGCCIKVALYWIIPFLTSNVWIGSFIELLEHYPMVRFELFAMWTFTWYAVYQNLRLKQHRELTY